MASVSLLLASALVVGLCVADYVTVDLAHNQSVRGATKKLRSGTIINVFKNIPYAASTSGDKRFAPPEEAPAWTGVKDALKYGRRCMQRNETKDGNESEDCLSLNIWSPDVSGSFPVMIFIHGGGFDSDSGSEYMYDSSTLCERGVVVVTINYRLGLFGFLSTGDDVMPGNYGMLDQVLAMEWVQKHIRVFGGDHNEVTIFGESAGAASVSLHTISPLSKDLFKRAIMESGASLSAWAVERPTTLIKISSFAKMIGEKVNCTQSDSAEYLTCLRGVDAFSLVVASEEITKELNVSMIATPRVETKFGFLPDYPENLLDKGLFNKVDTLRGYNSGEYSFVIEDDEDNGVTREEFIYFFLKITEKYAFENSTIEELQNLVEDQYLKNETNPLALRTQLIRGLTDLLFALSEALEIDKMSANGNPNSKHYLYQFNFIVDNLLELTSYLPDWMGVLHSAELPMVFVDDSSFNYAVSTHDQRAVGDLVQTMWTNFAKYGNPTENGTAIQWAPYSPANHEILYIDVNSTMTSFPSAHVIPMFNRVLEIIDSKPTS